ncbi:Metacaspase-1 [Symbiodinium microadriaticum]|uniref:Metacaspase-1 n=1 Tax=Symbiodinium microadriaticum TaxID=2951 RepID=A0A1Q9DCD1_SYMMI|nr:Metacaspase-1 [Symbiodinium microadriaticum]
MRSLAAQPVPPTPQPLTGYAPYAGPGQLATGVAVATPIPYASAAPVVACATPVEMSPVCHNGFSCTPHAESIPVTGMAVSSRSVPQTLSQAQVQLPGRRKSLLVGINYFGTEAELSGCIADVKRMQPFLEQLGFPSDQQCQMVLLDAPGWPHYRRPTLANMRQAIRWLVHDVRTGDALFFHYSGHGGREPSTSGADGYVETLCPEDYDEEGMLLDTELFETLVLNLPYLFTGTEANLKQALAGKAVSLALSKDWLLDLQSMRSGNPLGLLEDAASMGLGLWGLWKEHQATKGTNEAGFSTDEAGNVGLAVGEVVAITGCRSDQTSADVGNVQAQFHVQSSRRGSMLIGRRRSSTGSAGGALTSVFIESLQDQSTASFTYLTLLEQIRARLDEEDFEQVPQLATSLLIELSQPFSLTTISLPAQTSARGLSTGACMDGSAGIASGSSALLAGFLSSMASAPQGAAMLNGARGAGDEASALTELSAVAQGFAASQLLGGGAGWWQGEGFEQRPSIQTDGASPSSSASRSDEEAGTEPSDEAEDDWLPSDLEDVAEAVMDVFDDDVALLRMRIPPLPQLWAVLAAVKGKAQPKKPRHPHSKTRKKKPSQLPAHIKELCRVHRGLSEIQARHDQLPLPLQMSVRQAAQYLLLPGVLGDCVNVVGTYADGGTMAAVREAGSDVADYVAQFQLFRLLHIAKLNKDVFGEPKKKSLTKKIKDTRVNLKRVYSIGPERVEGMLKAASKVRHPTLSLRQRRRPKLPFFEIWTACATINRAATLLADLQAAKCNITGHGTDSEMYVTAEEFANRLDRQASKSKGKTGEVMINVDVIETILLEDTGVSQDGKFIKPDVVEKAFDRVNSNNEEPRHSKERKGTGFITKAMMMDILSKVEDEGDEEELQSTADAVSGTGPARRNSRCKERKGTGYVSKDKLQKPDCLLAMGSIDSVAGGLVLLHGTPMEQRRLKRGDIRGLLEDAQLDLPVRRRWPHWLKAFIKAGLQPALRLRLAELADWESKEDLAHEQESTWGRWKSWARSRGELLNMQLSQFFPFPSCPASHYVALRERHMLGPPQLKVCCREKVFARYIDQLLSDSLSASGVKGCPAAPNRGKGPRWADVSGDRPPDAEAGAL